jgi:hypothetical protein
VIEERKAVKATAFMTGIKIITAHHYIKKYHDDEERCLPVGSSKKFSADRTNKLTENTPNFSWSILTNVWLLCSLKSGNIFVRRFLD